MGGFGERRGQAAIEYLALVGFILLLTGPLLIEAQRSANGLQDSTRQLQVNNLLNSVEEAATLVYSGGEPTRVTFEVTVPDDVTQTNVTQNYVHVRLQGREGPQEYYRLLPFNVTGSIPVEQGRYAMVAEAVGRTNVSITQK